MEVDNLHPLGSRMSTASYSVKEGSRSLATLGITAGNARAMERRLLFFEVVPERRVEVVRRELLDRVKAKIADAIRTTCAHMSPEDFDALVTRMAQVEIKYNTRRTSDLFEGVSERDQGPRDVSRPDDPPASAPEGDSRAR